MIGVVALALGALPSTATSPISSRDLGHRRIERTIHFGENWRASCGQDVCVTPELFKIGVRSPSTVDEVDVTLSISLDYRTGPGPDDRGRVFSEYSPDRNGPFERMGPSWPLGPAVIRDVTSMAWESGGLKARGRRYFFTVAAQSLDADADSTSFVTGKKLIVLIEMWPAGP